MVDRPDSTTEVLAGLVERVTFHSDESGFCVLRVKARGQPTCQSADHRQALAALTDQRVKAVDLPRRSLWARLMGRFPRAVGSNPRKVLLSNFPGFPCLPMGPEGALLEAH